MFTLVKNNEKFYDFIRELRFHPKNIHGFLEKTPVTKEQQFEYMKKFGKYYFICLFKKIPVGFVGVVKNDIRICTHPEFKKKGAGLFMLQEIIKLFPKAKAKILKNNTESIKLFKKAGFTIFDYDETLFYLKYEI
jgi:RimJ/RimL family protein N-acetyltransferase